MAPSLPRALTVTAAAGSMAVALLISGSPPPATAAVPSAPAWTSASGVVFPGPAPGAAVATVGGSVFSLSNNALSTEWGLSGSRASLRSFTNKATGSSVNAALGELFTLTMADSSVIKASSMTVTSAPVLRNLTASTDAARVSERVPGKAVDTKFRYKSGSRTLDVVWTVALRDGANAIQQRFAIKPVSGTFDVASLKLVDMTLANSRVMGKDDGSPVVAGAPGAETLFVGVEHPMAKPSVSGSTVGINLARAGDFTAGKTYTYTASIGVAPTGQLRRSFQYYLERERAAGRHTFLHYQSWFDLKPPGMVINASELNSAIELFGTELTSRGAKIDSFWVDDGWDYLRSPQQADESNLNVWSFDPTQFPTGFTPQKTEAAKYGGASLSVWMSPFGGYPDSSTRRLALNESKPEALRYETHGSSAFRLGGPRYYERFRSVAFDMMDNQGVRGFKFDGIGGGLYQSGPNSTYLPDYEALLDLTGDLRAHQKDVWINATVGTWGSPYWLWYMDSVWRDGHDAGQAGAGSPQEKYVSYRDSETYKNIAAENPLFPVPSLMNHGIIFSERAPQFLADHDLTKQSVRNEVSADIRSYFAQGLGLQELYVRNTQVRPNVPGATWFWDTLAANAKWARANESLLSDVHWVGGDAANGDVYGTAAWTSAGGASKGMLMLRNPSDETKSFWVDPQDVFELPSGTHGTYRFTEKDGLRSGFVAGRGQAVAVTLAPHEVAVFEAAPSDETVVSAPIPRSGWTANAGSEETAGENGRAGNVLDGNGSTIWHTRYEGGAAPMPHWIDIDMKTFYKVDRLHYLPRQDGAANGTIADYQIQTSTDGTTWTAAASGSFPAGSTVKTVEFPATMARFVRLKATSAANGQPFAAAAEIELNGIRTEIDSLGWTVSADSEETVGENGRAANVLDGNASTMWHTRYEGGAAPMPHWIDIDMGASHPVTGLEYLPRQDGGSNGTIADYQILTSTDGTTWTAAASGTFPSGSSAKTVGFPATTARFVRLKATSAANGQPFAAAAEINLYRS
ncbi:discoidin domain-containing protein [Streptomyces sp. NPDC059352]|uniref:discoidin domain-containing protein n=1 Tax=Streptomyces sp. NPDC059352 TaxID=3346810 RepID=UPI00368B4CFC